MLVQFVLRFNLVCHHLMSFLLSIIRYRYFSCAFSTISLIYFLNNIRFNFLSNFVSIFFLTFFPSEVLFFHNQFISLFFNIAFFAILIKLVLSFNFVCHHLMSFFSSTIRDHHFSWPFSTIFLFFFLNNIRFDYLNCSFSILTLIIFPYKLLDFLP
jgi:hypothetical protein